RGTRVRKAVGQHTFGHRGGPLEQDLARITQSAGCQAQPADGDERVAPPIREPRVARNDGLTAAALNQISIRRTVKPGREKGSPFQFGLAIQVETGLRRYVLAGLCDLVSLSHENQNGV